ncbi:hypothetical protein GCM10022234_11100 [Aeromicrobium panaciterrae]
MKPERFKKLPEPVKLEDTVTSQDMEPVPDPEGGIDTDRAFLLRYGAL